MPTHRSFRPREVPGWFKEPPDCTIEFEGRSYSARRGEPVAITLLAHGIYVLGRSGKYHRPRGLFCGRGSCGSCLARVDGEPSIRACQSGAHEGLVVKAQHALGSAEIDLLGAIDWLFPGGLDHHHFMIGSALLNRLSTRAARQLSGVGALPAGDPSAGEPPAPELKRTQVAIVGAGRAGRAAAQAVRQAGLSSLVLSADAPSAEPLVEAQATVIGLYDDIELVAIQAGRQLRVHADAIVLATGAYEQPPACPGNDLPGVLALGAAERVLSFGVLPGRRPVVALAPGADQTTELRARALAAQLSAAGTPPVAALGFAQPLAEAHYWAPTPLGAIAGGTRVERAQAAQTDELFDCDAVIACSRPLPAYELPRQMGLEVRFDPSLEAFVPQCSADGATSRLGVFIAGELAGVTADQAAAHGDMVGRAVVRLVSRSAGQRGHHETT